MPEPTGTPETRLVVIRGNSGSGKSTVARRLRLGYGRGCALAEQDYLRRIVLRERDGPGGIAPALIEQTVRFALDHGYHAVLEGILLRDRYGPTCAAGTPRATCPASTTSTSYPSPRPSQRPSPTSPKLRAYP
jgi:hypothetical protein